MKKSFSKAAGHPTQRDLNEALLSAAIGRGLSSAYAARKVKTLLKQGANPLWKIPGTDSTTLALSVGYIRGYQKSKPAHLRTEFILIDAPKGRRGSKQAKSEALHDAIYAEDQPLVEKLVTAGADINFPKPDTRPYIHHRCRPPVFTPLDLAVEIGNRQATRLLLSKNALGSLTTSRDDKVMQHMLKTYKNTGKVISATELGQMEDQEKRVQARQAAKAKSERARKKEHTAGKIVAPDLAWDINKQRKGREVTIKIKLTP